MLRHSERRAPTSIETRSHQSTKIHYLQKSVSIQYETFLTKKHIPDNPDGSLPPKTYILPVSESTSVAKYVLAPGVPKPVATFSGTLLFPPLLALELPCTHVHIPVMSPNTQTSFNSVPVPVTGAKPPNTTNDPLNKCMQ